MEHIANEATELRQLFVRLDAAREHLSKLLRTERPSSSTVRAAELELANAIEACRQVEANRNQRMRVSA